MRKIKRPIVLSAILIVLLLLLAILALQLTVFKPAIFDLGLFKNYLVQKSTASLYIEGQKVKIKFNITKGDQEKALEFSKRLGVDGSSWTDGISLDLDKQTTNKLSQTLPLELLLSFGVDKLSFNNHGLPNLSSSVVGNSLELATGSGKLSLKVQDERDFDLDISDPNPLLKYATESGQIYLSKKVYGMFPILNNIARIELTVNGKNVNGEIVLK